MYPNKSYPLASAASWASGILCASQTANQVGTIIGTWRPFATERLVSPGNDRYSCSLLIRSHVQPLIRFPQAWPPPPRLRHASPRRCSTLRPSVGSRSTALAGPAWPPTLCCPFSFSGALQSIVFRWDEIKGFDKCKALFTGEMIIPISRASPGYLEIHSPQTRPPPDRTPPHQLQTPRSGSWPGTQGSGGANSSACSNLTQRRIPLLPTCLERCVSAQKSNRFSAQEVKVGEGAAVLQPQISAAIAFPWCSLAGL